MDISKLLATTGASSPDQPGLKGAADTGFAQVFKQAGQASAANSSSEKSFATTLDASGGSKKSVLPDALSSTGSNTDLDELIDDESMLAEIMASAMPGELTPLAQQISLATDGLQANISAIPSTEQELAQLQNATKLSQQAETITDEQALVEIRQRLDMIASAQRGETMAASGIATSTLGEGRGQDNIAQSMLAVRNDIRGDTAALRHQQLTAQSMQAATQQNVATPANGQMPNNFAEAVAALTGDDTLAGRNGGENTLHHTLSPISTAANSAQSGNGQPQVATALPTQTLSAPLASAQWQQGLGQQLIALHQRGGQQVDLHLHPAELGPLTISLKVDDQLAQAQFFSANPHVRSAVEQAIPQLREALEESGIQLGEAMVGEHHQRGESNEQRQDNGTLARGDMNGNSLTGDDTTLPSSAHATQTASEVNGIDLYA